VSRTLPRLSSRRHPAVNEFRQLAGRRKTTSAVLLDGSHLIADALAAGLHVRTVLVSSEFLGGASHAGRELVHRALEARAVVYETTAPVIDAASPVRTSSGIVAIADWTPVRLEETFRPAPALAVGLVDVQDPGNVGAVIRSADALGGTGVVAIDRTADPAGWKTLRGAMGSTFRVPVSQASLDETLAAARANEIAVVATAARGAPPVEQLDLTAPTLLLIGNEGAGLPPDVTKRATGVVTVPIRTGVDSLNAAVTAGILLYEARRQRQSSNPAS
jgi:TrmH family RNA methyltransferase